MRNMNSRIEQIREACKAKAAKGEKPAKVAKPAKGKVKKEKAVKPEVEEEFDEVLETGDQILDAAMNLLSIAAQEDDLDNAATNVEQAVDLLTQCCSDGELSDITDPLGEILAGLKEGEDMSDAILDGIDFLDTHYVDFASIIDELTGSGDPTDDESEYEDDEDEEDDMEDPGDYETDDDDFESDEYDGEDDEYNSEDDYEESINEEKVVLNDFLKDLGKALAGQEIDIEKYDIPEDLKDAYDAYLSARNVSRKNLDNMQKYIDKAKELILLAKKYEREMA